MRTIAYAVPLLLFATVLGAGVPPLFNFQGELRDAQGAPAPDGIHDFRFRIYDVAAAGNGLPCGDPGASCLWEESRSVSIQDGVYSVLLGSVAPIGPLVFDGPERYMGVQVDQDSEMMPRQRVASVPYALVSGSSEAFPQQRGTYYCGLDWDGDGNTADDAGDLLACLDAAKAELGSAEDLTDRAATLHLQEGNLIFCDAALPGGNPCPYSLQSGMNLVGVRPRLLDTEEAQDLEIVPNGGTWIDGNGAAASANGIFVGSDVRGLSLRQLGFKNFRNALRFGDTDVEGLSMSRLQDLYFVGISTFDGGGTETALSLINFQHVSLDHLKAYRGDKLYYFANDQPVIQGGNSVIIDLYAYTYGDPSYGVMLECIQSQLNFLAFLRPQVNAFNGTFAPGSAGFRLKGSPGCPVNSMSFYGIDVEGTLEYGLRGESVRNSHIDYSGGPDTILTEVSLDDDSTQNVLISSSGAPTLELSASANLVYGHWRGSETDPALRGVGMDVLTGRAWVKTDRIEVGSDPVVTGTAGRGVASHGPAVWADTSIDCAGACADMGAMGCRGAMASGGSADCATVSSPRVCFCN